MREKMERIIRKYGIEVYDATSIPNDERYRLQCTQNDKAFFGYKWNRFFETEKGSEIRNR